ncbi:hypothetical protein KH5_06810 [Urechidicola sp. KH5]
MEEFGTSDEILADILFGAQTTSVKLLFESPSSQEAVENQKKDVPFDSKDSLYAFGAGIIYN